MKEKYSYFDENDRFVTAYEDKKIIPTKELKKILNKEGNFNIIFPNKKVNFIKRRVDEK